MEHKKPIAIPAIRNLELDMDSVENFQVRPAIIVRPSLKSNRFWKYFGFLTKLNEKKICRSHIACLLCRQLLHNPQKCTLILRNHLLDKHQREFSEAKGVMCVEAGVRDELNSSIFRESVYVVSELEEKDVDLEDDSEVISTPRNVSDPLQISSEEETIASSSVDPMEYVELKVNNENLSSTDNFKIWDLVIRLMVTDLHLPDIVEGPGLNNILGSLGDPIKLPDKKKIQNELLHKVYCSVRNIVSNNLIAIEILGLTVEEWKNNNGQFFVTFTVHYETDNGFFESRVLKTLHAPTNWKKNQWWSAVNQVFQAWNIDSHKISAAIVGSERQELFTALQEMGLIALPCFGHVMKISAQAYFQIPAVSEVIEKCRNIIGMILTNSEIEDLLFLQQEVSETEQKSLVMDHASDWMSTLNMLEQIIARRKMILRVLAQIEDTDFENMTLTIEDWNLIENVIKVLVLFKVTLTTLIEENVPLVSLMIPLTQQLISSSVHTKGKNGCSSTNLNEFLMNTFNKYINNKRNIEFLQIATVLDPRVKKFSDSSFLGQKDVFTLVQEVVDSQVKNGAKGIEVKHFEELSTKKRRSGMEKLLGDVYRAVCQVPVKRTELELIRYRAEPLAPLTDCPSKWWSNMSNELPELEQLSRKYRCVPVCCTTSRRVTVDKHFSFVAKRANLPSYVADKLLFLNANCDDILSFVHFLEES